MDKADPDAPKVKIVPPFIYIGGIAAGSLVSFWLPTRFLPHWIVWPIGAVLIVLGIALAASAIFNFKSHGTTIRPDRPASTLVVSGPYKLTRNPMYVGLGAIYLGITIAEQSLWALILLPVVIMIIQRGAIEKEEAFLEQKFGADYKRYKASVRRWL